MKKINTIYWILTGLFAAFMIFSAIPDAMSDPEAIKFFEGLHMPAYLLPFLGIAKILGGIVILIPGFPRLKEWAYAGLFFDLLGAAYAIICTSEGLGWTFMFLPMAFLFGSYFYYHKKLNAQIITTK